MIANSTDDFYGCMKKTEMKKGQLGFNNDRAMCIKQYSEDLKVHVPQVTQMYNGYSKNFGPDGNLSNTNWTSIDKDFADVSVKTKPEVFD